MPINAVQVNANGGIYSHGKGHSFEKKLEVYLMLQKLKKQKLEEGDLRPVIEGVDKVRLQGHGRSECR